MEIMNVVDLKSIISDQTIVCILSAIPNVDGDKGFKSFYYGFYGDILDALLCRHVMVVFPTSYNRLNIHIR